MGEKDLESGSDSGFRIEGDRSGVVLHNTSGDIKSLTTPLPTSLVVKKGSKTLCSIEAGIPLPLSHTRISTKSSVARVFTWIKPLELGPNFSWMEWLAFTTRF